MKNSCPLCSGINFLLLYQVDNLPLFQNIVYDTYESACRIKTININLVRCLNCNFVFNKSFDDSIMEYDANYHNEQHYSPSFYEHMLEMYDLIKQRINLKSKIIEIGCGKGAFLELFTKNGYDIIGFDPAYEGNNCNVIKTYYSEKYSDLNADFIILRHTLEHISEPLKFLHQIAKANRYKGLIFIEVPDFDWIASKKAFWDIFHEHCNYFTKQTLKNLFSISKCENVFNGQYQYIIANLSDLKNSEFCTNINLLPISYDFFRNELDYFRKFIKKYKNIALWGGASKAVTFLNLLDPERLYVDAVIDINPLKQNKFIAGTGHKIIEYNSRLNYDLIIIMNENYKEEIKSTINNTKVNIITLGE